MYYIILKEVGEITVTLVAALDRLSFAHETDRLRAHETDRLSFAHGKGPNQRSRFFF